LLVDFRSANELAEQTLRILGDPDLKGRLEYNAYAYGRETAWPRVGQRMLSVLRSAAFASGIAVDAWADGPIVRHADDMADSRVRVASS
jgi:hypothetical protein